MTTRRHYTPAERTKLRDAVQADVEYTLMKGEHDHPSHEIMARARNMHRNCPRMTLPQAVLLVLQSYNKTGHDREARYARRMLTHFA